MRGVLSCALLASTPALGAHVVDLNKVATMADLNKAAQYHLESQLQSDPVLAALLGGGGLRQHAATPTPAPWKDRSHQKSWRDRPRGFHPPHTPAGNHKAHSTLRHMMEKAEKAVAYPKRLPHATTPVPTPLPTHARARTGPHPSYDRCKLFCQHQAELCTGEHACYLPSETTGRAGRCIKTCLAMDGGGLPGDIVGTPKGENMNCLFYWLNLVRETGVQSGLCDYACPGGGMCGPSTEHTCPAYCDQMTVGPGTHACCSSSDECGKPDADRNPPFFFKKRQACLSACRGFGRGPADVFADTLECRLLFLGIAEQSVATFGARSAKGFACPHAGRDWLHQRHFCSNRFTDVPGLHGAAKRIQCKVYCGWMGDACPGALPFTPEQKGDAGGAGAGDTPICEEGCMGLRADGVPGVMHGNTLQCRLKAVAVAARSRFPSVHCAHDLICVDGKAKSGPGQNIFERAKSTLLLLQEKKRTDP